MISPSDFNSWIRSRSGAKATSVLAIAFAGLTLTLSTTKVYAERALPAARQESATGSLQPASSADLKTVKALDKKYQDAPLVEMDVEKLVKLGLLGTEKKSAGKITMSKGRLRMELEGDEKSLLVINSKKFWAVTFPGAEFKDAPVQVITGDMGSKKSQSQSMLSLLTQGGFLKFFNATGVQKGADGESVFFLQPKKEQTDFKRAQLKVSADAKEIRELRYWDQRDNETVMAFKSVKFGNQKPKDQTFSYTPPSNAEIMKM